jgi:hypothetical protein
MPAGETAPQDHTLPAGAPACGRGAEHEARCRKQSGGAGEGQRRTDARPMSLDRTSLDRGRSSPAMRCSPHSSGGTSGTRRPAGSRSLARALAEGRQSGPPWRDAPSPAGRALRTLARAFWKVGDLCGVAPPNRVPSSGRSGNTWIRGPGTESPHEIAIEARPCRSGQAVLCSALQVHTPPQKSTAPKPINTGSARPASAKAMKPMSTRPG